MKNNLEKHVRIEKYYELIYRKKGRLMKTVDRYDDFDSARADYKYLTEQDDIEYDYVALNDVTVEKTTTVTKMCSKETYYL
ncbi:MAG: hypothetical protein M0Q88_01135 [Bacilli bacterium]|nr:hypothetical protein [Bacilli bacterium]